MTSPTMQKSTTHWPSIIILIIIVGGAGIFLLTAIGFGIASIISLVSGGGDPAGTMIGSLAAGFEGLLLIGVAWLVFQKTNGGPGADAPFQLPYMRWHIYAALVVGIIALIVGGVVSFLGVKILSWLVLPVLTLLIIVPPIWVMLGLGTTRLDFGPRWRAFGIFGIGMTLGPLIMISLELVLAVLLIVVVAVVLAGQPGLVNEITRLAALLENETNPEVILSVVAPYVFNPGVIGAVLAYISLAVPVIEELLKPLGVWLFLRKIETPAQGFTLGLLSGAAYALIESLSASGQGSTSWIVVVIVRAGTSLLHIVTTGLMGWAIISAVREGRYLRLIGTYLLVVLIHGIWNAAAIGAGLAITSDAAMNTNWSATLLPAAAGVIVLLGIGMIILLVMSNRKVRKMSGQAAAVPSNEQITSKADDSPVRE